ncbi:gluconokinase [Schaalia naturae]|uniref:Gluconokinase n=1 Tax=Schaalia naturae TaxID=635203 RepID=A0ABW2SN14_9ACTO
MSEQTATAVASKKAAAPLVLAMDIGSTSTRAAVYDAQARPVRGRTAKVDHLFREGADGTSEIDADQVVGEVADVITRAVDGLGRGAIAAVALDTFASSLICIGPDGEALTPCLTYADSRSVEDLARLRAELDEVAVHQAVGTRLHTSYHPPRLLWLARTRPGVFAATTRFASVGEYVYTRLADVEEAATSTMAWTGMLDRATCDLDVDLLEATGTSREQYAPMADPDQPVAPGSRAGVAQRWPALEGAAWFPAVPDGYASNLGVGATSAQTVALSAATSGAMRVIVDGTPDELPPGLWAYRVSRRQSIVGGALNDVGRVMTWLEQTMAPVDAGLLDVALRGNPVPGTPLVLPFLTGERATGWAGGARAAIMGVSAATGALEMWRGAAEGLAVSYARIFEQIRAVDPAIERILASGGVTHHYAPVLDVVTQALGFPMDIVDMKRMTMRGTAMMALSVVDPGGSFAEPERTPAALPDPSQRAYYDDLRARFEETYGAITAGEGSAPAAASL